MRRFGDRYRGSALRFPTGYGPRMSSRTPEIVPPDGGNLLFDWNPAIDPYVDQAGGLPITNNGVTFEFQRGAVCGVFDGSSYLVSTGSPFSALSDLANGCSIYVVCERTDAGVDDRILVSVEDSTAATLLNTMYLQYQGDDDLACGCYDGTAGSGFDLESGALSRNTQQVASGHWLTTQREARVDGSGTAESSGTTRNPTGLDRVFIGAFDVASGIAQKIEGRIWRVLIYDAAYSADVVDGL